MPKKKMIAGYCKRNDIVFINTFPLMLGEDGQPKGDIFEADKLHLNAKGYAIWREAIGPHLREP